MLHTKTMAAPCIMGSGQCQSNTLDVYGPGHIPRQPIASGAHRHAHGTASGGCCASTFSAGVLCHDKLITLTCCMACLHTCRHAERITTQCASPHTCDPPPAAAYMCVHVLRQQPSAEVASTHDTCCTMHTCTAPIYTAANAYGSHNRCRQAMGHSHVTSNGNHAAVVPGGSHPGVMRRPRDTRTF
jgi:hypothetical protein